MLSALSETCSRTSLGLQMVLPPSSMTEILGSGSASLGHRFVVTWNARAPSLTRMVWSS